MNATPAAVRKINPSDREDILEISSKIWGGHDYLPYVLDEWLASKKCHTYGVEVDGRIVAIGNLRLVDGNKTAWMEGLRVHPNYRKRGYANLLTQHFLNLGETLNVRRFRYTTGGNNRVSLKLARKAGFKRLLKMSAFWYEEVKSIEAPTFSHTRVKEAKPQEAYETLKTNEYLIPCNILMYDWKAVEANSAGFKVVGKDHGFYITKKGTKLQALSFGHTRPGSERGSWSFTVYASDEDSFLSHFCHHMNTALGKDLSSMACTCQTRFAAVLKERKDLPKSRYNIQLVLLEKQVRQNTQAQPAQIRKAKHSLQKEKDVKKR